MFRNATMADLDQVAAIYDRIHTEEEAGRSTVGWIRGVYPTRQTALASIQAGDLFVAEEDGQIVATAKINQEQVPVYASAAWSREAKPQEVMVLHTLVVDPQVKGKGWAAGLWPSMRTTPGATAAGTCGWTPTSATPPPAGCTTTWDTKRCPSSPVSSTGSPV